MSIEKKLAVVNKKFSEIIRNEETSEDIQKLRAELRKIENRIRRKQDIHTIRLNKIRRQKSIDLFKTALEEYPFSIIKAKSDVIEGPYMEYAAKYRSVVFVTRGFLMFVLGALFSVLFIGIPPNVFSWGILVNIVVALIFVFMMGIFSAFTPVFTNRQLLPTIVGTSLLGVLAIVIGVL